MHWSTQNGHFQSTNLKLTVHYLTMTSSHVVRKTVLCISLYTPTRKHRQRFSTQKKEQIKTPLVLWHVDMSIGSSGATVDTGFGVVAIGAKLEMFTLAVVNTRFCWWYPSAEPEKVDLKGSKHKNDVIPWQQCRECKRSTHIQSRVFLFETVSNFRASMQISTTVLLFSGVVV